MSENEYSNCYSSQILLKLDTLQSIRYSLSFIKQMLQVTTGNMKHKGNMKHWEKHALWIVVHLGANM